MTLGEDTQRVDSLCSRSDAGSTIFSGKWSDMVLDKLLSWTDDLGVDSSMDCIGVDWDYFQTCKDKDPIRSELVGAYFPARYG